jgi:uncharacterized protein YidB (DUF937 family)
MGLLDGLLGQVLGKAVGGGQQNALLEAAMGLLNNQQMGGIGGLLQKLQAGGLGDHVASWVGTGQNQAVSADQIHNALGGDQIQQIAQKIGIEPGHASEGLAALLPQLIDKLTPNGSLPQGQALDQGLAGLKKLLS